MRNIYLYKGRLWKEIHDFRYTGGLESFHLNKGDYFVLCDGAHGGDGVNDQRMYGGRAMGILHLKKDSDLFAAVGGDGTTPSGDYNYTPGKGGWNGGADGGKAYNTSSRSGSGGGGASDIRISSDQTVVTDPDQRDDVPIQYKQLKSLGSSKGQYNSNNGAVYRTNYVPNSRTKIVVEAIAYSAQDGDIQEEYGALFGSKIAGSNTGQFNFWIHTSSGNTCLLEINGSSVGSNEFIYDKRITITMDKNSVTWTDGTTSKTITTSTEFTDSTGNDRHITMFASYDGRNYGGRGRGEIFSFKIYEDDVLVRDYVPIQVEGSTTNFGMYDMVTGHYTGTEGNTSDRIVKYFTEPIRMEMYSRIIVGAGSGGGRSYPDDEDRFREFLGSGGSAVGTLFAKANEYYATQTEGYSFGVGQVPPTKIYSATYGAYGAGGGGGGWFGGYANPYFNREGYSSTAGGGGSSYVLTEDSFKPEGYTPDENYWFTDPFMDSGVAEFARIIVAEPIDVLQKDDIVYTFCTGNIEEFPIKSNMKLQVECYGGAGGARHKINNSSLGGYTKGIINAYPEDKMYVNVGGTGIGFNIGTAASYNKLLRPVLGYNGGGQPARRDNTIWNNAGGGGGATDVRICENRPTVKLPTSIRYARMEILERRNEYDHGPDATAYEWFQMSQLFFKDSSDIIGISEINAYVNESGDIPVTLSTGNEMTESPASLIDGTTDTKFACRWDNYVNIIMKFDKDVSSIESYGFSTADDYPVRDPFVWRIYVSETGTNWVLLDTKMKTDLPETRLATYEFDKESFEIIDPPSLHTRVIVAGGGGGNMVETYNGNDGGGTTGGVNTSGYAHRQSGPGGQDKASRDMNNTSYSHFEAEGVFGHGGNGTLYNTSSAGQPGGGGGWFGGSGSVYNGTRNDIRSGCGGSGYVLTKDSFKPEGYNVSDRYYVQDGETVLGGNNLSRVTTMCKITVLETNPILILMKDKDGVKSFNKDSNTWEFLTSDDLYVKDFIDYGSNSITTDEGLADTYDVLLYPESDNIGGKELSIDKVLYDVIPSKQCIRHIAKTPMNPRSISLDAIYDKGCVDAEVTSKRSGAGDMAELTIDLNTLLKTDETEPKFFSVYIEASLNLNGNRYIPPKSEEETKPVPKPGDPDYYEKDLLPVGRKNSIPREYYDYLDKVGESAIQTISSAIAKCYDREVYIFAQLNNTVIRMMKYNTITKETKILFEVPPFYNNGEGPGDFEIVGNKVVYSSSRNNNYNYHWKVYDMDTGTVTTVEISNYDYNLSSFGKIVKLNSEEVVLPTSTGVVIYNAIKNTYVAHVKKTSRTAYRDFAIGNKYYAFTRDANTMTLIDRTTLAVTTVNLPDSTATVITFYEDKFYLAKNGALYVFNEDTLTIDETYLTPWSDCRTINVEMGVAYVICKNNKRLWIYDFKTKRYDSIYMSWAIPEWSNMVFRPATMGGSLWVPYWKLLNISYVGLAKYNFGQKYGQYYIRYCSDVQDEFEFDNRFVTFYDTYATVHAGIISKDTESVEEAPYKKITMSKKEYSQIRNVSFECSLIDKT